ncbi:MAG TPA: cyclase family protein [Thermoplasmata archaeon]|nr:cyclase family protein [Thermoplasmata archaeon]
MPTGRRVHDLTALLETHMATWSTSPSPVFEPVAFVAREGYSIERIDCFSHTGTHMDAPSHFLEDGATVDAIAADRLVGTAAVLDVRSELEGNLIPVKTLAKHWPKGWNPDIALLRTDWSHARARTKHYLYDFPGIDPSGARWLVEQGVHGVGTDTLSIDPYTNSNYEAHKVLLGQGIWILEALDHLDALAEGTEYTVVAAPLKIAGGSGAMARVLAIEG